MQQNESSYTDLAVSVGEVKTDVRNILTGIGEIKDALGTVVGRITDLETAHAVTEREAREARREASEAKAETEKLRIELAVKDSAKESRKPPWTAIGALGVASFVAAKQYLGF